MEPNKVQNSHQPRPIYNKSKSTSKIVNYEDKLAEVIEANIKLKELMQVIRNNTLARKIEASQVTQKPTENQNVVGMKKKQSKMMAEIQQLTKNLNGIINENNKLKAQVDSSRNSRVIYSNIYKNLQKQIHKNEFLYRSTLIDLLCYEETQVKVTEKIEKAVKKLEKEVNQLEGVGFSKKKEKKKSGRIDTGLSSIREMKGGSKDTGRGSSKDIKSNAGMTTKRDEIVQEGFVTRREAIEGRQQSKKVDIQPISFENQAHKTSKSIKSRTKLPMAEQINEYYQFQMKSNYYDNIAAQLLKICGVETMEDMNKCWQNVDKDIQQEYRIYLETEEALKKIEEEKKNSQKVSTKSLEQPSHKTAEEIELAAVEEELGLESARLGELSAELTTLMDLNCQRLSDDEIGHHIMRIKRRGGGGNNKELDKLLESAIKERSATVSLKTSRLQSCK